MPRPSRKKQARLAFAPTTVTASSSKDGNGSDGGSDRQARLSYGHPSMAAVRSQGSRIGGSEPIKRQNPIEQMLEGQVKTPKRAKQKSMMINLALSLAIKLKLMSVAAQLPPEDSSEDEIIVTSAHKRKRPTVSESEEPEDLDIETPRARRLKRKKADAPPVVLSDSDEPVASSPAKRLRRGPKADTPETPRAGTNKYQDEIDEDVKDLQDSGKNFAFCR